MKSDIFSFTIYTSSDIIFCVDSLVSTLYHLLVSHKILDSCFLVHGGDPEVKNHIHVWVLVDSSVNSLVVKSYFYMFRSKLFRRYDSIDFYDFFWDQEGCVRVGIVNENVEVYFNH